jgi:glycerol-3-phosphate dehydrogenase (NAD(P)+)
MTKQPPVLVLGAGAWGTALALILARNGQTVWLWGRNSKHLEQMKVSRQNERFLPQVRFPESLHPITSLEEVVPLVQNVVVVVPSQGFRDTLLQLAPYITANTRLCWATKGLEEHTGLLLHQVAQQVLGTQRPLAVLSGPSFATEVAAGLPTAVTIASSCPHYAQDLVSLFHNPNFRPYTSNDLIGVQLGGAVKNVMAIAAGIADGLGLGANTRAALITRGLTEMVRFGMALGGQRETFMGLAGLGDLVLTCTDNQSRNRRFGYVLAQGKSLPQARAQVGAVIEGIQAAHEVCRLASQLQIVMPIADHVNQVLQGLCTPTAAVQSLLSREPKQETL